MTVSYEQLMAEHDDLAAQAAGIVLMTRGALDAKAISAALDRIALAIDAHLTNEDGLIYPVAAHLRRVGEDHQVMEMTEQLAALRADWCDYLARWTEARIAARADEFTLATGDIMGRLMQRVNIETEMLYPIALREGIVPLRRAAPSRRTAPA